eukprot:COSAG02_NODE_65169_length_258_cov_1.477987_1_plen_31_part_10
MKTRVTVGATLTIPKNYYGKNKTLTIIGFSY